MVASPGGPYARREADLGRTSDLEGDDREHRLGCAGRPRVLRARRLVDKLGGDSKWTAYGALGFVVIVGGTVLYNWVKRQFTEYTITDKRLNVRWGILSKRETTTTLDRIQNLTITQTLVDRILNTGTIDFDTASDASDERFRFHGVNEPGALRQKINQVRLGSAAPGANTAGL